MKSLPIRISGTTASLFHPRHVRTVVAPVVAEPYRCYGCRREGGVRKGSIFERSQAPFSILLPAVKLFELITSVREAARQPGLAYNTAYRLHHLLRAAILCTAGDAASLKGWVELDESYFGGRRKDKRGGGAAGKVPVFGILERGGTVRVEVVRHVKGETLLDLTIRKVKRGSLVYTDRFQCYNGLVSYVFRHQRSTDRPRQAVRQREGVRQWDRRILVVRQVTAREISWG